MMGTMKQLNGWHLPSKDGYFTRFVEGAPKKENGFQREHLQLALAKVRDFDFAIDVGAHVGFWTLDMATRFDNVLAFEPCPDTFECLLKNMAQYPNVICAPVAVGDHAGQCAMLDDPDRTAIGKPHNTGARFVNPKGTGTEMIALDDLGLKGCDLLKIDVEGFEPAVLAGAKALIQAYRPVIIMETDKRFAHRFGFAKAAARMAVIRLGYQEVEYLEPDPRTPGRLVNAIRPDRIFVPEHV